WTMRMGLHGRGRASRFHLIKAHGIAALREVEKGQSVRGGVTDLEWRDQAGRVGTISMASPSRTVFPSTEQTHSKRARCLAGNSSTTLTFAVTVCPILTGARKLSVCEM